VLVEVLPIISSPSSRAAISAAVKNRPPGPRGRLIACLWRDSWRYCERKKKRDFGLVDLLSFYGTLVRPSCILQEDQLFVHGSILIFVVVLTFRPRWSSLFSASKLARAALRFKMR